MKLIRASYSGTKCWKWIAPTGSSFYLIQRQDGRGWVYYTSNHTVSSETYPTLQALKEVLQRAFDI
jgi:hypothetical protein